MRKIFVIFITFCLIGLFFPLLKVEALEYPSSNPTFTHAGYNSSTQTGRVGTGDTLLNDGVFGYLWVVDSWTGQYEKAIWTWDFDSLSDRTYYIKWKGTITAHASYGGMCYFTAQISPDESTWTTINEFYLNPGAGQSSSFDLRTDSITGNYRYMRVTLYSITSGMTIDPTTRLWVDYVARLGAPNVTTSAATEVTTSEATLNGNITDTDGQDVDERGFDWGTSPGNYPNSWTETGSFGTGSFSHQITGLDPFTTYYFRAKAHTLWGWGYGEELSFYTITGNACADVPIGGGYTVTASCSFPKPIDGVDNGGIIINSDTTLTINAGQTIVWSPGFSVVVDGTIAINKGGGAQLRKTYLWMIDADSDNYPTTTTQYAQDTAPTNGRRRYLMNSISSTDCDDAAATKWQYFTGYTDADDDNYGTGSSQQICSGESLPDGYTSQGGDCYDANANAKPGQTSYFTTDRGDGSFDYDCNGQTNKHSQYCDLITSCNTSGSGSCGWYSYIEGYGTEGGLSCGDTGKNYCDNGIYKDSSCSSGQATGFYGVGNAQYWPYGIWTNGPKDIGTPCSCR
jgi:hypothetical protein